MAAPRVAMRNIKECLRLKFEAGLSHEKIARALQLSKGVVSKYIAAARVAGLDWPALVPWMRPCCGRLVSARYRRARRAVSGCCRTITDCP